MSGPYFDTWKHQTLVRFAKDAYEKLQRQDEELQRLRLLTRRDWVGLTDEEIEQVCVPLGAAMLSFPEVARAIESKLKEKFHAIG